jgi:hypothetical protein
MKWLKFQLLFNLFLPLFAEEIVLNIHQDKSVPFKAYVMEVDLKDYKLVPVRALGEGVGKEKLSSMVKRHGAIAGINGGFYEVRGDNAGLPTGILKIGGKWFTLPKKPRGAIGWDKESKKFVFDRLLANAKVQFDGQTIEISGINQARLPREKILYLPTYHKTTLTPYRSQEFLVSDKKCELSSRGSNVIPENGFVVSYDANALIPSCPKTASWSIDVISQTNTSYNQSDWALLDNILGGTPLLIHQGKVIEDFSVEKTNLPFLEKKHARTALGIKENGHLVLVVVEGEQEKAQGFTMAELAVFMHKLGCVEALNLCGGHSSTLVFQDKLVNKIVDDGKVDESAENLERGISDAILIFKR